MEHCVFFSSMSCGLSTGSTPHSQWCSPSFRAKTMSGRGYFGERQNWAMWWLKQVKPKCLDYAALVSEKYLCFWAEVT